MELDHEDSSFPTPLTCGNKQLHFRRMGFIIFLRLEMYSITASILQCSYTVVNHVISQFIKLNIIVLW